jgi:hypothetical protein
VTPAVQENIPSASSQGSDSYLDGLVPPPAEEGENTSAQTPETKPAFQNGGASAGFGDEMMALGEVIEAVKQENMILYSMIMDAKAYLDKDVVTFRLNPMGLFMVTSDDSMKQTLERICSGILGYNVRVNYVSNDPAKSGGPSAFPEF